MEKEVWLSYSIRKNCSFLALIICLVAASPIFSQGNPENPFSRLAIFVSPERPREPMPALRSAQIKGIEVLTRGSGLAWTSDTLFRTDDDGESWREVSFSSFHGRSIVDVKFLEGHLGWIVANESDLDRLMLLKTEDGGVTWTESMLILPSMARAEVSPETVSLDMIDEWNGFLKVVLPSSSNFDRRAVYRTSDGGNTWEEFKITSQIRTEDGFPEKASGGWELRASGYCAASKTGCVQETRIFSQQKEITPAIIKTLAAKAREKARRETRETIFSVAPNGNTRVSLGRGFDKCTAATSSQMQTWWNESPFYDANIYLSGRNRGCSQPQLTAGWVETVSNQGWGLIPTVVGYQSPCSTCTSCAKHSSDAVTAEQQGRGEADIAIADANALGLTTGTVLYYDMERYNDTSGTGACSTPTKAFLKGWTERLHETGYVSGVYGSPTNAVEDWLSIPETSRMDAVWLARWDNIPSVWTYASPSPTVPDTVWQNHQRIKQWQAPHNETWGGVTFNIDGNIADAPVAAAAKPKNKTADFDGDGKTDVSVWRPDTSVWYIINSSNSTFHIQSFGLPTDILTPGDYDGDGKTDLAVWRPSEGIWHQYSRSIHTSFQFGSSGDIPVPADYDGDGRTDFAVYRPSTGVWYIKNSLDSRGTSYTILSFGLNGDKPVPGDYDGDGKADLAVWRPSDGNWYLLQSTQGFSAVHFGLDGDKPAQGDYDGDGKTDFGIFRNGVWYLLKSQEGLGVAQFGLAGDMPTTGDFDGDNKSDIAVFRPSNGTWYMLQSQSGFTAVQFGRDGDKPVPNAYLPE